MDPGGGMRQLFWFDRAGRRQAEIGKPMRLIDSPSLSRSERFVALSGGDLAGLDIWILYAVRATNSRLTTAGGVEAAPAWTSNDQETIHWKTEEGTKGVDIFIQKADGREAARALVARPGFQYFMSSSRDGRFLFYTIGEPPRTFVERAECDPVNQASSLLGNFCSKMRLRFASCLPSIAAAVRSRMSARNRLAAKAAKPDRRPASARIVQEIASAMGAPGPAERRIRVIDSAPPASTDADCGLRRSDHLG